MRYYSWDNQKNQKLIAQRQISFEEIVLNIENGNLLDDLDHPNQEKYEGQRILMVEVRDYVYLVPYLEEGGELFLITIIPSRKATKKYLKEDRNNEVK